MAIVMPRYYQPWKNHDTDRGAVLMKFWKRIHDENLVDEMSSRRCRPQVTVMDMASTALSEIGAKL